MNLLVFGATGATGRQIVSQALGRGHSVVAFVRDRSKMNLSDANLAVIEGDIQSVASIRNAFSGHVDAVISALGVFHRDPRTELSDGTRNLLQVAEEKNVTRFIVITSLGVGDSRGQGNLSARLFQKFMLAEVLADKQRQEAYIKDSGCDWTIVRPPRLIDAATIAPDVVAWQGPTPRHAKLSWKTTRATVANFILDVAENGLYMKQSVNLSELR